MSGAPRRRLTAAATRAAAAALAVLPVFAGTAGAAIGLEPVLTAVANPVFVTHAGDGSGRLFVVGQAGTIHVLRPGAANATTFLDIRGRVASGGERGLLGLAFHPAYAQNGRFFVFYTRVGDGALTIAEHRVSADADVADAAESVLLAIAHPTNTNHNGGMLAFGPDGYLYIGVGDGGGGNDPPNNAQRLDTLLGKILRIDVDRHDPPAGARYASPPDNPFVGGAGRAEIYAYGWRNPWRFSFDRLSGIQWVADVGQNRVEEVDAPVVSGGNYGWRIHEGLRCTGNDPALCDPARYRAPVFEYLHDNGRCSVTGGYVYRGVRGTLPAGTYVHGDFCTGEILAWDGRSQRVLLDTSARIASFGEDESGELYVVDLAGTVSRIVAASPCVDAPPAGGAAPPGTSGLVDVIEFYNGALDHYFLTWLPGEIAGLDRTASIRTWQRTGFGFRAHAAPAPGTTPVCRFYLPPAAGDSHFFGRDPTECDGTARSHPDFVLEAPAFMHLFRPAEGRCPARSRPIHRVFSNRADANHRYTARCAVRDAMVANGWLAEGDGPELVAMCAPE